MVDVPTTVLGSPRRVAEPLQGQCALLTHCDLYFRAASQPGGGQCGGPAAGEGICVFSKPQCWAHPQRIMNLMSFLPGPEDHAERMGQGHWGSGPKESSVIPRGRLSSAFC